MASDDQTRAELAAIEAQIKLLIAEGDRLRKRLPEYRFPTAPGYRGTHWGAGGTGGRRTGMAGDPRGKLTLLGTFHEIAYVTTKNGYPNDALFRHQFRSGGDVTYTPEGRIVICGGKYRVTMRGIEG